MYNSEMAFLPWWVLVVAGLLIFLAYVAVVTVVTVFMPGPDRETRHRRRGWAVILGVVFAIPLGLCLVVFAWFLPTHSFVGTLWPWSNGFYAQPHSLSKMLILGITALALGALCSVLLSVFLSGSDDAARHRRRVLTLGVLLAAPVLALLLLRSLAINPHHLERPATDVTVHRVPPSAVTPVKRMPPDPRRAVDPTERTESKTEETLDEQPSDTSNVDGSSAPNSDSEAPAPEQIPEWVAQYHKDPTTNANGTSAIVCSGQFTTEDQAKVEALSKAVTLLTTDRVTSETFSLIGGWTAPEPLVRDHLVRATYTETVDRDFGTFTAPMYRVYLQLDLREEKLAPLRESFRQFAAHQRLWLVGGIVAAASLLLAATSALLRWTQNRPASSPTSFA